MFDWRIRKFGASVKINKSSIYLKYIKPLRFTILNRFHQNEGKLRGTCLFGKLNSGIIEKNKMYVILP